MTNNKITWFVLAFALVGCGKKEVLDVNPEFQPYIERFEQLSGGTVKVTNLTAQFGKMQSKNENGACEVLGEQTPAITINQQVWEQMDDLEREALLFHELGHCVLKRNHVKKVDEYGDPVSLMNPYRLDAQLYVEKMEQFHAELYAKKNEF